MKQKRRVLLLRWFYDQKIGTKIIISFVLAAIVPIIASQSIGYYVNEKALKSKLDTLMLGNLTQIAERVDLTVENYTNVVYQLYVNEIVADNATVLMSGQPDGQEVAYNNIYNQLQQAASSMRGIRCISVICSNGMAVSYDVQTASTIDNLWRAYQDPREIPPYVKVVGKLGMLLTPTMRFHEMGEDHYYFHISKTMYDYNRLGKGAVATLVMSIDADVLGSLCAISDNEAESGNNINFITDENGYILAYPDLFYTGIRMNPKLTAEQFVAVTGLLKNQNTAMNIYTDTSTGWRFYNVYDQDYMLRDITNTQRTFVLISLLAIVFSSMLILYTVKSINKSVHKIIAGIKEVQQGNLAVQITLDSHDEMGQIAHNFNDMTTTVQTLIEEVTEATGKQKEAEIRALEAQINPHFLYNTLDSINWMAIEKDEYEISKMIRNLGVILRYSISKSNHLVSIDLLADWLDKYISLQQMRFNNSFTYKASVDNAARGVQVYKLLLQPFVENAIIHGFKGVERGGILRVDISLSDDGGSLCVIIEDNGVGMPPETVRMFNNRAQAVQDEGSIGLHNAFARMEMYYGDKASWNVSGMPGLGTVITLRLPVQVTGTAKDRGR